MHSNCHAWIFNVKGTGAKENVSALEFLFLGQEFSSFHFIRKTLEHDIPVSWERQIYFLYCTAVICCQMHYYCDYFPVTCFKFPGYNVPASPAKKRPGFASVHGGGLLRSVP
jgi:hypothetical protein